MAGPTIQGDLYSSVFHFRTQQTVFTADQRTSKGYVIPVKLMGSPTDESIQNYELTMVTYGTASDPNLATCNLQLLAKEENEKYPTAFRVLSRFLCC
jgi:hypothetical protein